MSGNVCFISLAVVALAGQQDSAADVSTPLVHQLVRRTPSRSHRAAVWLRRAHQHVAVEDAGQRLRQASGRVIWKPLSFSRPEKFRLSHRDTAGSLP